jgi:hypothetical protein
MRPALLLAGLLLVVLAVAVWRAELWTVQRPGERPEPLALIDPERRTGAALDVALPAVPVGMQHLRSGEGALVVHYWAPWERNARDQARQLDSLAREPRLSRVRVVLVCFDPFPSVARFVARQRLRLPVLLDGKGELRRALPCPSIPFTYALDSAGRISIAQAGEVDWWSDATLEALTALPSDAPPRRPAGGRT